MVEIKTKDIEVFYLKCPKCDGEMEERSGKWNHNLTVKAGLIGMKRPVMYVCKNCGYIEFYLK